jgi:hypothetical protein
MPKRKRRSHQRDTEYKVHLDRQAFEKLRPQLLENDRGKWALIGFGKLLAAPFSSPDDAYAYGFDNGREDAGTVEFVVIEIAETETPSVADLRKAQHRYIRAFARRLGEDFAKGNEERLKQLQLPGNALSEWTRTSGAETAFAEWKNRRAKVAS